MKEGDRVRISDRAKAPEHFGMMGVVDRVRENGYVQLIVDTNADGTARPDDGSLEGRFLFVCQTHQLDNVTEQEQRIEAAALALTEAKSRVAETVNENRAELQNMAHRLRTMGIEGCIQAAALDEILEALDRWTEASQDLLDAAQNRPRRINRVASVSA